MSMQSSVTSARRNVSNEYNTVKVLYKTMETLFKPKPTPCHRRVRIHMSNTNP